MGSIRFWVWFFGKTTTSTRKWEDQTISQCPMFAPTGRGLRQRQRRGGRGRNCRSNCRDGCQVQSFRYRYCYHHHNYNHHHDHFAFNKNNHWNTLRDQYQHQGRQESNTTENTTDKNHNNNSNIDQEIQCRRRRRRRWRRLTSVTLSFGSCISFGCRILLGLVIGSMISRSSSFLLHRTSRFASPSSLLSSSFSSSSSCLWMGTQLGTWNHYAIQRRQDLNHHHFRASFYHGSSSLVMMPEGPEVRIMVNQLQPTIVNCRWIQLKFLSGRYKMDQKPTGWKEFQSTLSSSSSSSSSSYNNKGNVEGQQDDEEEETIDRILDWNCKGKFMYILLDPGRRQPGPKTTTVTATTTNPTSNNTDNNKNNKHNKENNTDDDDDDWQRSIWITLGLSGRFVSQTVQEQDLSPSQQALARWYIEVEEPIRTTLSSSSLSFSASQGQQGQRKRIYYHDARNFGTLRFSTSRKELNTKLQSLGPDILQIIEDDNDKDSKEEDNQDRNNNHDNNNNNNTHKKKNLLAKLIAQQSPVQQQKANICKFLMNQSKLSGVGNYILTEALYRASIDPYASLAELNATQQDQLFEQLQAVAQESYQSQQQRNSSLKAATSEPVTFELQCYGRKTCPKGNPVLRDLNGPHGRTIWFTTPQLFRPLLERPHYRLFHKTQQEVLQSSQAAAVTTAGRRGPSSQRPSSPSALSLGKKRPVPEKEDDSQLEQISYSHPQRTKSRPSRPREAESNRSDSKATNEELSNKSTAAKLRASATRALGKGIRDDDWRKALSIHLETKSFQDLADFLRHEDESGATIYPPSNTEIFGALNSCPLHRVKVVILGQDPYHGPNQAHGLAFSVRRGVRPLPPSLRNIFKELQDEGLMFPDDHAPAAAGGGPRLQHGNLQKWADQGVLLLNTVLTVRAGQANSHKGQGWEEFTDAVIQAVLSYVERRQGQEECEPTMMSRDSTKIKTNNHEDGGSRRRHHRGGGVVFLLWGNPAANKATRIIDPKQHVIIQSSHPSPLSAARTKTPFFGSNCFRRVNEALEEMGQDPIDWNVNC